MIFGKRKKTITLAEVLRGTEASRVQSVGYMQVIPLTSDLTDDRFVSPAEVGVGVTTTHYGTLVFDNSEDTLLIVPCHTGYVVQESAQDHAMAHAGLVKARDKRAFDTARCVQQTQGGLIRSGHYQMIILPFALREQALKDRNSKGYDKLWGAIAGFNREMGIEGASHLEYFLERFGRELDEFVAEFECVPHQVGAIILIDDHVVGIERAPSHAYWQSVWPALIRECYGSLAIQVARSKGETPPAPPGTRVPLPEEIGSLDDLGRAVEEIAAEEESRVRSLVRELLDERLTLTADEEIEGLNLETLEPGRFVGQVVRDGERIVYASILSSKRWLQGRRWAGAKPFTI